MLTLSPVNQEYLSTQEHATKAPDIHRQGRAVLDACHELGSDTSRLVDIVGRGFSRRAKMREMMLFGVGGMLNAYIQRQFSIASIAELGSNEFLPSPGDVTAMLPLAEALEQVLRDSTSDLAFFYDNVETGITYQKICLGVVGLQSTVFNHNIPPFLMDLAKAERDTFVAKLSLEEIRPLARSLDEAAEFGELDYHKVSILPTFHQA